MTIEQRGKPIVTLPEERPQAARGLFARLFFSLMPFSLLGALFVGFFIGGLVWLFGSIPTSLRELLQNTQQTSTQAFLAGVYTFIFSSFLVGFGLPLSLGLAHRAAVRRSFYRDREDADEIRHVRKLALPLLPEETIEACLGAVQSLTEASIEHQSTMRLILHTGPDWKVFPGDSICFDLQKIEGEQTLVRITTQPVLRSQLVDYGRNLVLIEELVSMLGPHPPAPSPG